VKTTGAFVIESTSTADVQNGTALQTKASMPGDCNIMNNTEYACCLVLPQFLATRAFPTGRWSGPSVCINTSSESCLFQLCSLLAPLSQCASSWEMQKV